MRLLYKCFDIKKHNSSVKNEILAGVTNYFTLIYAVMLVPEILIEAFPGSVGVNGELVERAVYGGLTGGDIFVVLTATAFIAAGLSSVFIGFFIDRPFIQGPSAAIAAFISYTVCRSFGYSYNQALAIVFLSGILFFVLSFTGMEERLHNAIPSNIKFAVSGGIGFFIASSGLLKAHIIEFKSGSFGSIFGADFSDKNNVSAFLTLSMVLLIAVMLKKHIHCGVFLGKIFCIVLAAPLGLIHIKQSFAFSIKDVIFVFRPDFGGLIDFSSKEGLFISIVSCGVIIASVCIMDIFETISMFIALENYVTYSPRDRDGNDNALGILEVDAVTTSVGALIGSTNISTYVESTAGVIEGGRTGMTAVVTGLLFLCTAPFAYLAASIPSAATATTLIAAGVLMMGVLKHIDFEDITEAVPAFLTMLIMPFANSILAGISIGVISYIIIHLFIDHNKKISPFLYIIGFFLAVAFVLQPR